MGARLPADAAAPGSAPGLIRSFLQWPLPTPRQVVLSAVAGALGFALNYAALPVFGGTSLIFGSLFSILAAVAFGPYCGGFVALLVFSQTWLTWGHPYGLIVFSIESWVVGWLVHRRRLSLLRAAGLYWLCLGVPLTAVFILQIFAPPFPVNFAIFLKYPANAFLVVAFAQMIAHSRWFWRLLGEPLPEALRRETMRDLLLRRLVVASAFPALVFGVAVGVMFNYQGRQTVQRELSSSTHEISNTIHAYLRRHQRSLEAVARALEGRPASSLELNRLLEALRHQQPGFLTMLAAGPDGTIIANSPALAPGVLTNVADREYFRRPVQGGEAYLSPVFRGRGFGQAMIVAVSVAYLDNVGQRHVLEGSLDLRLMNDEIARAPNLTWRELFVFDAEHQLVLGGDPTGREQAPTYASLPKPTQPDWFVDDDTSTYDSGQAVRKYGVWQNVPDYGWHVYLREDAWQSVSSIARFYFAGALALAGILTVGWLLSRQTAQQLTRPFHRLVRYTDALVRNESVPPFQTDVDVPGEWRQLADDLTLAASTLAEANERLQAAVAERDRTAGQLRALTNELELRVAERTAELEKARAQAERASQAKSDFLATVSHELRTPLNVALGHIYLLLNHREEKLAGRPADRVRKIKASADHLLALINDILDLAKLEAGRTSLEAQTVDVARLCEECGEFFREEFSRNRLRFTLDVQVGGATLHADPRRLRQMLLNLLSNAVKFTPEGGLITLRAAADAGRARMEFTVSDTGIGISAEQQQKLFRPFEQVDSGLARKFGGSGLGLSIVRRLADLHGGTVTVDSTPGQGSHFTISLPFSSSPAPLQRPT